MKNSKSTYIVAFNGLYCSFQCYNHIVNASCDNGSILCRVEKISSQLSLSTVHKEILRIHSHTVYSILFHADLVFCTSVILLCGGG